MSSSQCSRSRLCPQWCNHVHQVNFIASSSRAMVNRKTQFHHRHAWYRYYVVQLQSNSCKRFSPDTLRSSCLLVHMCLAFSNHTRAWLNAIGRHEALFHQTCTKNRLAYHKTHLSDTLTPAYHSCQSHLARSSSWPIDSFTVQRFSATSHLVTRFALAELHPLEWVCVAI